MSDFPRARLVTEARVGARVLYDFNITEHEKLLRRYPTIQGWSLGSPSRSSATGPWGTREITLRQVVSGPRTATVDVIAEMDRALVRPRSFLEFQLDAYARPMWFPVTAHTTGRVVFDDVTNDTTQKAHWIVQVELLAKAWAEGEPVEYVLPVLGNDPTTGGCRVALPPILGAAPTPLTVSMAPDGDWGLRRVSLVATATDPEAERPMYVWQASDFTTVGGTSDVTADPAWPGAGYRTATPSVDGPLSLRMRMTDLAPAVRPGRYAAYLLCGPTDGAVLDVQVDVDTLGETIAGPVTRVVSPATVGYSTWAPVGEFALPTGVHQDAVTIHDDLGRLTIRVHAGRVSGTGGVRLGAVMLVPVDGPGVDRATTTTMRWPLWHATSPIVIDAEAGAVLARTETGAPRSSGQIEVRGAWPYAVPGMANVFTLLQQTSEVVDSPDFEVGNSNDVREATTITVTFRPRHVHMPSNAVEAGLEPLEEPDGEGEA